MTGLCNEPRGYIITTKEGVQYTKTQPHLKPYHPQVKKIEDDHLLQSNHMQTVKSLSKKSHKIDNLDQKRTLSLQLNWIYKKQCNYLLIRLDITCFCSLHISGYPMEGRLLIV